MVLKRALSATKPWRNVLRARPVLAIFELSLRCNSACGYCNLPLNQGRFEMSREQIRSVFGHLFDHGIRLVLVQGGEPLVRRDALEVLEDMVGLGLHPTLVTNGTRLTGRVVQRLGELGIPISVSLDTLQRERYRRIRGADQLRQVMRGVALLERYPHPKFMTCILTRENRDEVAAVMRYARRHGFTPVAGAYHWGIERYGKPDRDLEYDRLGAIRTFEGLLERDVIPRGYFRRYVRDNIDWLRGRRLEPCDAGRYSIAIDASGNVAPCLALSHAGNLLHDGLENILKSFDRAEIRQCSERSSCNLLCSRVVGTLLRHPLTALSTRM